MIEIESESTNLQRLPTALVLPGADSTVERLQQLIVTRKQRSFVYLVAVRLDLRIQCGGRNYNTLVNWRDRIFHFNT